MEKELEKYELFTFRNNLTPQLGIIFKILTLDKRLINVNDRI
jgi:hypothetical protein